MKYAYLTHFKFRVIVIFAHCIFRDSNFRAPFHFRVKLIFAHLKFDFFLHCIYFILPAVPVAKHPPNTFYFVKHPLLDTILPLAEAVKTSLWPFMRFRGRIDAKDSRIRKLYFLLKERRRECCGTRNSDY